MTLASWSSSHVLGMISSSGLLFGLMLLAAIVGGYAARFVHVPRVVGFLLGGIALRLILHALFVPEPGGPQDRILQAAAEPLSAIRDLALGMILFSIGGVFQRSNLKNISPAVLRIGLLEILSVVVLVFAGCLIAALLSPTRFTGPESLLLAGLLAVAAIATAPAATLFVLQEYDAKGPITDTILALTGVNNFVCVILFYSMFFLLASVGAVQTHGVLHDNLWVVLAATTIGSVSLGIVCGTLISIIHAKLALAETVLIFIALFILLGAGEPWFFEHLGVSYNFLLAALVMGGVFANIAIDTEKLVSSLRTLGSPVFAGFFVMAGYDT
ncbi:MAG: hypothetical protein KJ749_11585, partial [Planctomycetes bacterium]|nr:hypothetical protein [Planctomycetota bacterium]